MFRFWLTLIILVAAIGCGGGGGNDMKPVDMGGEDGTKIAALVEDLNELKEDNKKLIRYFAKGVAPTATEAKKFSKHTFYIAVGTKPTVNGGEGTAKVSIYDNKETKELAQKEWAFVKEGNAWKIKSATLP